MSGTRTACRLCGHATLRPVLSLGCQPLANQLMDDPQRAIEAPRYPLEVAFCETCSLLQISESVPPEALFTDYLYFSSYSETMLEHAETLVDELVRTRGLDEKSRIVEIASNDGYLLQYYLRRDIPVLGIEPAENVAKIARSERGVETLCEFFTAELAQRIAGDGKRADVIHANNVLAHVPDLNGFVAGIHVLLNPEGVAIIEFPYAKDLLDGCEFDTVYHEHLCYFAMTPLNRLFKAHALQIVDVERIPIHGGSLRLTVSHEGADPPSAAVSSLLDKERAWGVDQWETYSRFAEKVEVCRSNLCAFLVKAKSQGKRVAAYGAAAKGSTMLNFFGIGTNVLDFVADRSPHKQGKFMPGIGLPIVPAEALLERAPDYVLLLVWNFAEEVLRQQQAYRDNGGKFVLPIPELRVI